MEKSLKYYLSILVWSALIFSACGDSYSYYKKEIPVKEYEKWADQLTNGMGYFYQGSVPNMFQLYEARNYDPNSALISREIGVPYLKRGFPVEFHKYYAESANLDPYNWQGWRGYLYLYFYRDYERALIDFDATDILTPDFVDYPQSLSVDYMRAICYYYLDQPQKAIAYMEKHIELESSNVGRFYVDSKSFLLLGKAHEQLGNLEEARQYYLDALKNDAGVASILFHLAQIHHKLDLKAKATEYLDKAQNSLDRDIVYRRNYVDEFFKVFQEDITALEQKIKGT